MGKACSDIIVPQVCVEKWTVVECYVTFVDIRKACKAVFGIQFIYFRKQELGR